MLDLRGLLGLPAAYQFFIRLLSPDYRRAYVRDYVRPLPGQRVIDFGCGPGDVLDYLPEVDYLGIDINPRYIKAAEARFGSRGVFRCEDLADTVVREAGCADLVMANGVLHHLDDGGVRHLLGLARRALKPGGRLITFDGTFVAGQSWLARLLLRMDRGRFVRTPDRYVSLAREVFGAVDSHVRHDLLHVPYTHHIMVCSGEAVLRQSA